MIRNIVYQIASFIVLGLVAVSCSDDLVEGAKAPGGQDDFWSQFDFVIADDADTRVAYDTDKRSTFEAGDEVGVYVVDSVNNLISDQPTNVHYVVRDVTNLNTGERHQVLLPADPYTSVGKDASYRYILYYPYNVNMTLTALKSYTHTIDTDQNASSSTYAPELTAFEHSDLLWCYYTPPTDGSQTFQVSFDHAMAQIVVELDESTVYAPDDNAENTGVYLLNMPMQASNINLLQSWSEDFSYATTVPTYDANSPEKNPKIHAWKFGTGASGKLQFRAMVPAHKIEYLNEQNDKRPVVRIFSSENQSKDYYLKSDLDLKPGYTYTFTFSMGQTTTDFEVSEDDSWVLDVLDPETGAPVGLLCREYLRYQPNGVTYQHTGDPTPDGSKYINSQAWVFYNLRADGTPELKTGTVLRFTYDVQAHFNNPPEGYFNPFQDAQAFLPAPHVSTEYGATRQGIFLPKHGYYWTSAKYDEYLKDGKYGTELIVPEAKEPKLNEQNYYMHGGTVTWAWDASNNHSYISNFTLPTKDQYESSGKVTVDGTEQTIGDESGYITNKQAYYFGHIAIGDNGQVGVSYQPISTDDKYKDIDGNKVGVLQPHYLIDRRITTSGTVEENRYPLVKIGHNQFWMSKSLQAKTFTDGTPITCYNTPGTEENPKPASVTFSNNEIVGAGYIYPFSQTIPDKDGKYYDPYNDPAEMNPTRGTLYPDMEFSVAPMYNKPAVEDERFVPQSTDSRLYYQMPTSDQVKDMQGYFDKYFVAKISTDMFMKKENGAFVENYEGYSKEYYSALYGLICDDTGNHYCANISGFNLKARGYFLPGNYKIECLNTDAVIILKSKDTSQKGVDYYQFPLYAAFDSEDRTKLYGNEYGNDNDPDSYPTQLFAQVRMVMKYRNQLDNGGASTRSILQSFSNPAPSVSQQATDKRHVRIVLE